MSGDAREPRPTTQWVASDVDALEHADKGAEAPAHPRAVHPEAAHDGQVEVRLGWGGGVRWLSWE